MATTPVTTVAKNSGWVRRLPNALPAAGYITLRNSGGADTKIPKIGTPDYKNVTIYQAVTDSESSKMVKVDNCTVLAKGEFSLDRAATTSCSRSRPT